MVTAKGWYWQILYEIGCHPLFCESGCQPVYCNSALLYYAVKPFINLSVFLVVNLYIVLVHLCTGVLYMNHACVMLFPCPTPIYEKESSF